MNDEEVIAAFHRVLTLKDRAVCASIDAANCRTSHDWRKSREASGALEEAIEQFEKVIVALTQGPRSIHIDDLTVRYSLTEMPAIKRAIDAICNNEPARAVRHLAKVGESREQSALALEQHRRTWEANAIVQAVSGKPQG